jgi:hypothetical protein
LSGFWVCFDDLGIPAFIPELRIAVYSLRAAFRVLDVDYPVSRAAFYAVDFDFP